MENFEISRNAEDVLLPIAQLTKRVTPSLVDIDIESESDRVIDRGGSKGVNPAMAPNHFGYRIWPASKEKNFCGLNFPNLCENSDKKLVSETRETRKCRQLQGNFVPMTS